MSRNIATPLMSILASANCTLVVMGAFAFRSKTEFAWSGVGPLLFNGNTYLGVGSFGKVADVTECGESNAQGTSVQLSGIDQDWLAECISDIRQGGAARLWLGALSNDGQLVGTYLFFRGQIDKAPVSIDGPTATITLNLETKMIDHARPNARRLTSADQHANGYPDDTAFVGVENLQDQALYWDN